MVDDVRTAGGTPTITEPLLAGVTQDHTRRIVDITVATCMLRQLLRVIVRYNDRAQSITITRREKLQVLRVLFRVIRE